MIKWIIILFLLTGCGPTLLTIGVLDVTTGDVVANGVKYKLLNDDKEK